MRTLFGMAFLVGLFGQSLWAEPWMSNRFAQNCAGCHAPGRYNQKPIDRRCTLSCQGCHVNPNGGGLRNKYGKWNQQRWMKSTHLKGLAENKFAPAPHKNQNYIQLGGSMVEDSPKGKGRKSSNMPEAQKKEWLKEGAPLRVVGSHSIDESLYSKYSYEEWHHNASSREQWLSIIPEGDPYRQERKEFIQGGGDFRYIFGRQTGDSIGEDDEDLSFLMAAELGLRVRPVKEKLSFVFESSFQNGPQNTDIENGFNNATLKSAYVIADDLFWNSYAMWGMYRPMFGHHNPDHTALREEIAGVLSSGGLKDAAYKAVGIGASPNVPFFSANLLQASTNPAERQEEGYVVSVGGRFVTLGLSLTASLWDTTIKGGADPTAVDDKKSMYAVTGGASYKGLITNLEFLRAEIEDGPTGATDAGNCITAEFKYRFWRENYAVLNYATSNVTRSLGRGSAGDLMFGVKTFPIPGLELELLSKTQTNEPDGGTKDEVKTVQLLAHVFF